MASPPKRRRQLGRSRHQPVANTTSHNPHLTPRVHRRADQDSSRSTHRLDTHDNEAAAHACAMAGGCPGTDDPDRQQTISNSPSRTGYQPPRSTPRPASIRRPRTTIGTPGRSGRRSQRGSVPPRSAQLLAYGVAYERTLMHSDSRPRGEDGPDLHTVSDGLVSSGQPRWRLAPRRSGSLRLLGGGSSGCSPAADPAPPRDQCPYRR